ncbi:MAG: putative S-layer protein [Nanoarchaeota archaeon]|nr:putative S-layer protein [Nanoarchaeota archaeon]
MNIKKRLFSVLFILILCLSSYSVYASSIADHVVISEIQTAGGITDDEFIELYNPTSANISLYAWRLSRKTSGGSLYNLLTTFPNVSIQSHGYFLIASIEYDSNVTADANYSTTQHIADDNTVILYNDSGTTIIDKVGFGNADNETSPTSNPPTNGSIERKSSFIHNELEGNGWDTDNNSADFVNRTAPEPQNSYNSTEHKANKTVCNNSFLCDFTTIQDAIDAASPGDTINVAAGTYNECSITVDKSLTLLGAQANVDPRPSQGGRTGDESVVDGNELCSAVFIISADDVEINGFTITGGTGDMVEESGSANNLLFQYNILYDDLESSGDEGIQIKYSDNVIIQYNYAYNIIQDAFNIAAASNSVIRYNEAHDIYSENAAIYCYDATNIDIIGNLIYDVYNNDGIKLGDSGDGSTGGIVKDNVVHDVAEDGITIYASGVTVDNNTIYDCDSENGALYLYLADNSYVTNNKIYNCDAIGLLIRDSDNVTVTGNDIYNNDDTNDNKYEGSAGIWITSATDASTLLINYNSIYGNADYGLKNDFPAQINAENNWWGDPSGPGGVALGLGDNITSNVLYYPWYTNSALTTLADATTTHCSTIETKTITNLTQNDYTIQINVTLNNTGSVSAHMYDAYIKVSSFESNFANTLTSPQSCGIISAGSSCTKTFDITIKGGTSAGTYHIDWKFNWTNNDLTNVSYIDTSSVIINANPVITVDNTSSTTINHDSNGLVNIKINSSGNSNLDNVTINYTAGSLPASWLNYSPANFTSISANSNNNFSVNISVPKGTPPANYTGVFNISAASAVTKTVVLTVTVPLDNSWRASPSSTTTYHKTDQSGLIGTVYINNTGNIDNIYTLLYSGTIRTYGGIWNSSNPSSVSVTKQTRGNFSIYHKAYWQEGSYDLIINITPQNGTSNVSNMTLILDKTNPSASISYPSPDAYVSGITDFNVSANDSNGISLVQFYVDSVLKNTTNTMPYSYDWNTSELTDNIYPIKAIVYDMSNNTNTTEINVTINNTDSVPHLYNNIPTINWSEDATTTLNLSLYFRSIDGDNLTYTSTNATNVTVSINNTNSIVTFAPDANFSGINYIVFYANDTSGNITASNNVTLNVTNINDLPTIPTLVYPDNDTIVYSATGQITLNWSTIDADNDTITSYLYFANSTNLILYANTTNTHYTLTNLNNKTKYYWRVNAYDAVNYSGNSSIYSFNITFDSSPIINNYTPTDLTPSVAENSSLNFSVNATDPDGGPLNYTWNIDGIVNQTNGNNFTYNPGFNDSGIHIITVNVTDNNSNTVSNPPIWNVTVTNTDRAPVLTAINNQIVNENSTLVFNITATDDDLIYGDNLSYSSNLSVINITRINNTLATVTWTPTNDYVGNNSVNFTVTDGTLSDSKIIIITVNNINDAPVLTSIGALAAYEGTAFSYDVNATDVDAGDNLTFKDNSTLFNITSSTGLINFTPTTAQIGNYSINISVNDTSGAEDSEIITLTISNSNDAPVLGTISDQSVLEDSTLTFNITASDADLDYGDSLSYSSNNSNVNITKVSNTSATVTWTPTNDYVGNNTINFTVTDNSSLTDSQLVVISVNNTNDAPVITAYYPTNLNPKIADLTESITFNITKSDVDAGDSLSVTWYINGTVNATSSDSMTISALSTADYNITVFVNDSSGNSTEQEWKLTASNLPITTSYNGTITAFNESQLDNAANVTINHTSYGSIDFGDNILDLSDVVDLDSYVNISNGAMGIDSSKYPQLNRSSIITMRGLSFSTTPTIYYNSGFSVSGTTECPSDICTNISYSGGTLRFRAAHFSMFFVDPPSNQAPVITSTAVTTAEEDESYEYDVDANDPDNDTLTYSLTTNPSGMSINSNSGLITWTPGSDGNFSVVVVVSDGSLSDTQSFDIEVAESILGKVLEIDDVDVNEDELKPDEMVEITIEIENNGELDIEDIELEVKLLDEDGDVVEDEYDDDLEDDLEFDLDDGDDEEFTFTFKMPANAKDNDKYTIYVEACGEDDDGIEQCDVDDSQTIKIEREKHDVEIYSATISPSIIQCSNSFDITMGIKNIGKKDEDVRLTVTSDELGISKSEEFELEAYDEDDYKKSLSYAFAAPSDLAKGTYSITIKAEYDDGVETRILELTKGTCKKTAITSEEKEEDIVIKTTSAQPVSTPTKVTGGATTVDKFTDSFEYTMLLIILSIIVLGLIVFAIGATIIKGRY